MASELTCWKVQIALKEMDMSGGDNVDGPRWTGGYVDVIGSRFVVAPTQAVAEAAALCGFYEHQRACVKSAEKICEVHVVAPVHLSNK